MNFFKNNKQPTGANTSIFYIIKLGILLVQKYGFKGLLSKISDNIDVTKGAYFAKGNTGGVKSLFYANVVNLYPMRFKKVNDTEYRLNLVLDSLDDSSLFGGGATAVIFATLFSNTYSMPLRIITRQTPQNEAAYYTFLKTLSIDKPPRVEFFSDVGWGLNAPQEILEVSKKDIFIACSWWTAHVVNGVNLRKKFFHFIQENETVFYPNGDSTYWCENTMKNPKIVHIVNSKILFEFFKKSFFQNIPTMGTYFEPAFPEALYTPGIDSFKPKKKYRFLFYARPHTYRNMYYTGIKLIEEAIELGILNTNEWEIYFAGEQFDPPVFSNGAVPHMLGKLTWEQYSNFLKTVDLGFSLLYTPHPGYMPMDVVSSGGVSLTNTYHSRTLNEYSPNIICRDLDDTFVSGAFSDAVMLAKNPEMRRVNYLKNNLNTDWETSFKKTISFVYNNK